MTEKATAPTAVEQSQKKQTEYRVMHAPAGNELADVDKVWVLHSLIAAQSERHAKLAALKSDPDTLNGRSLVAIPSRSWKPQTANWEPKGALA